MLRCVHVVPGIAHEASGPSYSVPRLCEGLFERGLDLELYISDRRPSKEYRFPVSWFSPMGPFASRLGRSPELYAALKRTLPSLDVLHNHSLWMMANVYPGRLANKGSFQLITSPRGTLSPWALKRSRLAKRLFLICGQRMVLKNARCIHATSEAEYLDIRRFGLKQPVAVIPNGYDIPLEDRQVAERSRKRLLYLGRIHPVKALDNLVAAWNLLGDATAEWELCLVGPGEERDVAEVKRQIEFLQLKNVSLCGAEYGDAKSKEYSQSDAYILASHSENFAMTVAEALAHGLPAIVSKGAPWSGLEKERCGWWVDNDSASLARAMSILIKTPIDELKAMGNRGRAWIRRDFSWDAIAEKMEMVYRWAVEGSDPPPELRFD